MVAFPSEYLPTYDECLRFFDQLREYLGTNLPLQLGMPVESRPPRRPDRRPAPPPQAKTRDSALPSPGDYVQAILLEEKTKKGGWKAKYEPASLVGPIQNSQDVPADKKPGDIEELRIQICNPNEIHFRWPTEQDRQRDREAKQQRTEHDRRGGRPGG